MQPPSSLDGVSLYVPTPENVAATAAPPPASNTHAWKDGQSFGFHDFLDTINPLQHIPVVSTLYRWITGDTPGNVAEVVGDGIYGGPFGVAAGLFTVSLKEETGKGPGELALAALGIDSGETQVATAQQSALGAIAATAPATAPTPASAAAAPASAAAAAPATASASAEATPAPAPAANLPAPPVAGIPLASAMTSAPAPLIPLQRRAVPATASAASSTGGSGTAEQAFVAQRAAMQRSLYGTRPAMPDHPVTQPIPLHLTGPALPPPTPRPILIPANAVQPAAAPAPTAIAPSASLPSASMPAQPVDISQRMMDALDKYAKLQQERQRGQQLDLTP